MEHVEQVAWVGIDGSDAERFENSGEGPFERVAVFEQVGGTRGAAPIVFQDVVNAIGTADQIAATNVDVDVRRHVDAAEFGAVVLRLLDVEAGDDLVFEDLLVVIDVVEEEVERDDALR